MGAQPKPRSGVASLARHDLPSRAAVMLTCAVCSLLRASCLFSRSHPPFSFPLFLSPSPLALSSVTHAKGLALASVSIATVQASIPQSGPRLRFGATPLVPCPFAFQPNLDSVRCVAEQALIQSHSKTECRWTRPEVAILGADQKERGLWGREWADRNLSSLRLAHFFTLILLSFMSPHY